jgi:hypothetical protein
MSVNRPGQPDGSRYFFIAGIMLAIFILFRIGYVRHDAHETIATVGLSLLCLMHVASMPFLTARRRMFRALNATALLCCFGLAWISINRWTGTGLEQHLANPLSAIPSGDELRQQYEEHVREFRVSIPPISAASRGVDVIPVLQAAVFAHGLPFQPRPMIHSYLAFTPRLMKLNADFLHDPTRAPDSILFDICTIDHRFPSQDDALSWLEILSRYEPRHESGDLLLLERAAEPKTYSFESERRQRVEMGRWVVIPQADHPVWIRIDLKRTAGGALVEAIYKLPPVVLQIRTADGIEESFRLIPPVARSGFLLSPAITDRGEFEALYAPDWQQRLNGRLVQQMRLLAGTETGTSSNYEQNFDLSVAQLVVAPR